MAFKHCAERKKIAAGVEFLGPRLLRRHVSNRADRGSRARQLLPVQAARLSVIGFAGRAEGFDLRQSKIQNLGVSAVGNEDIRRLDVAMNDAF